MRIRALSVFERVIYHCWVTDGSDPCHPHLDVEAVLRPGDADDGALLLPVAEYIVLVGGLEAARPCLDRLAGRGRIESRQGVDHLAFPIWTPVDVSGPARVPTEADRDESTDPCDPVEDL